MTPSPSPSSPIVDWISPLTDVGNLIAWLIAPIIVTLLTWYLTWKISDRVGRNRQRRERRRRIVTLMAQADSLIRRAIVGGEYTRGDRGDRLSIAPEYHALVVETLALFEWGEEDVAFWAALELAAAINAPADALERAKRDTPVNHWRDLRVGESDMFQGVTGVPASSDPTDYPYLTIRFVMLQHWAELTGEGPRYAESREAPRDLGRHYVFPPQTDSIAGIEMPYILLVKDFQQMSEREMLDMHYGDPYPTVTGAGD